MEPPVVEQVLEILVALYNGADKSGTAFENKGKAHWFVNPDHLEREAGSKIAVCPFHYTVEPAYIMSYFGAAAITIIIHR